MKRALITLAAAAGALALASMGGAHAADAQPQGKVHSITLPTMPPDLPDAPGKDAVMSNCILCHSMRYVTMQPALSRETWVAEVTKMRKTFGAPIAEEKVEDIVNYLYAVRGKAATPTPARDQQTK